jgi:hypothetical protein
LYARSATKNLARKEVRYKMKREATIRVPLYRIEGKPGLQVGRCVCVTGRPYEETEYALGIDKKCSNCGMYFFDRTTNILYRCKFVTWAYSTPEQRKV